MSSTCPDTPQIVQVGIITFALGLFRLGFLDVVLSRALLKGFITAVGVVIFVEQVRCAATGFSLLA